MHKLSHCGGAHIEYAKPQRHTIHSVWKFRFAGRVGNEGRVFIPLPPRLPNQKSVRINASIDCKKATELSPLQQPVLVGGIPMEKGRCEFSVEYIFDFHSRTLVDSPAKSEVPTPPGLQDFLVTNPTIDWEHAIFQKWLNRMKLRKRAKEGDIGFAKRVYEEVCRFSYEFYYYLEADKYKASAVCQARKGDCGSLSIAFVAALRANQIPARLLTGRHAFSGKGKFYQWHVYSEFFVENVGWIPVDVTAKSFGQDPGPFFTMHLDTDLVFNTKFQGRQPLQWMQEAHLWPDPGQAKLDEELHHFPVAQKWQVQSSN